MAELDKAAEERRGESFLRLIFENIDQYAFGIITQHGYQELENKLSAHALEIERKFHKWFVRGLVAFGIMALCCSVSLIGFGFLLNSQGDVTDQIQAQRYSSLRDLCLDQNKRHDDVIAQIDDAVAAVPPPPARQRKARESAKPFKLILEAAVPYTDDCNAAARARVKGYVP